ncbi:DUF167 domain-containing protein [Thermoproteota archaeon]
MPDPLLKQTKEGITCSVRLIPRSSENRITDVLSDGTLKIKLTAPAIDNKANDALIKFLADCLHIKKSSILIIQGHTNKHKLLCIKDINQDELFKRFEYVV